MKSVTGVTQFYMILTLWYKNDYTEKKYHPKLKNKLKQPFVIQLNNCTFAAR